PLANRDRHGQVDEQPRVGHEVPKPGVGPSARRGDLEREGVLVEQAEVEEELLHAFPRAGATGERVEDRVLLERGPRAEVVRHLPPVVWCAVTLTTSRVRFAERTSIEYGSVSRIVCSSGAGSLRVSSISARSSASRRT